MKEKFLNAKHWQLFISIYGIPFLFQIVVIGYIVLAGINHIEPSHKALFPIIYFVPFLVLLPLGVLFAWYWSVGKGLQSKIPVEYRLSTNVFKFTLIFPVIYLLIFLTALVTAISNDYLHNESSFPIILGIIIPVHLFMAFCGIYNIYFASKTFKTAELQRPVSFSEYVGEFLMIWFYFLGIWFLQPKINLMMGENYSPKQIDKFSTDYKW
ncbi:hypothetical protein [Marinigracilibium pacificum]|uniref:Uncharacterized protein n=1 Tax=Marinigracilibium pacificum TaxID=2729599 RepID=A0A848IZ79_9BACT|nr:hypothetical protein [Marinigracilibium pacificum]NMM47600.1 hypothetical protein [Marinigracilibium pacificum]